MSLGTLVLELQGNLARTQEDMGRLNQIVENTMRRIDDSAARSSRNIQNVAASTRAIQRVEGADQVVKDLEKVSHSSVGARRELLVLAHELSQGNFKRAAGSVMVLGERMDWMGAIMSPVGLTVAAVAATIGIFAIAALKGAEESREFANSILLTGNYAGLTEGRYNAMSQQVAESAGVTIGASREITQELISTGRFGSQALNSVAMSAARFAEVSGQKSEEVVKFYEKMSDGVLKWAVEANKQYHFLDGAIYDHIKALEQQGHAEEAEQVASKALYDHLGGDAVKNLGALETAWNNLKEAMSAAKDELLAIGRAQTPEQQLKGLQAEAARLRGAQGSATGGINGDQYASQLADVNARIGQITRAKRNAEDNADLTATRKQHDDQVVEAKTFWDRMAETHKTGAEQMQAKLDEVMRKGTLAGASPADIATMQAKIRAEFAPKGGGNIEHADLQQNLKPLQDEMTAEEKLLAYREQVLKQYYKSDQISIQGYYDTRRTVIEANIQRTSALYDQEIALLVNQESRAKNAAGRIEAATQAQHLQDEKNQALLSSSEKLTLLTQEQAADTEKYRDEVTKLTAELDKLNRTQGNSAGADFDRSHAGLRKQATVAGDSGALDTLAAARSAAVAQAQMNQLKEQAAVITEKLGITEKQVALEEMAGQKTQLEGMIEISRARGESSAQLEQLAAQMQQVAEESGMPVLITNAQQFKQQTDSLSQSANILGKNVNETFANGFAKALDNTISRTKTLKQSFLDMGASIEQEIEQMVSKDLANTLFGIGSSSGGGGWLSQIIGIGIGMLGGDAAGSEAVGASSTSTPDDLISGYRATGGPTMAGGMYEVNERGPELLTVANRTFLMMGDQPGKVTPTGDAGNGGSGRNTFNMNIAVPAGTTRQTAQQQAGAIMRQAQIAMARNN